ncbi:hypothetical protein Bhyg_06274 [Pseudolycoriella hygida]|uniref:Uncharacterized protein n=1 Tax=Pseudolycoriella hygida TaxID=35572 RepID=A0A9Q0S293_9DIPT|nr:hypothetical protein Bhyg_06274 [Pseudolycoriella hygida]
MVDLSGANDPFQHGFSNSVFILPAIVVLGLTATTYELVTLVIYVIMVLSFIAVCGVESLDASTLSPEELAALEKLKGFESQNIAKKLKVLGLQMENMDEKEKVQYSGQMDSLTKSLGKLRRLIRKKMPDTSWQTYFYICVVILILIYAFFGYKLYRSLTEKDRKREEKLKAKQSKKKK